MILGEFPVDDLSACAPEGDISAEAEKSSEVTENAEEVIAQAGGGDAVQSVPPADDESNAPEISMKGDKHVETDENILPVEEANADPSVCEGGSIDDEKENIYPTLDSIPIGTQHACDGK